MCGILIRSGGEKSFNHRQLKALRRRGPDEIGFWSDGRLSMAHARLSIIGLDERGTEPMENATHVLTYNGEIYNFNDYKSRLDAAGVHTTGANDAEVLLHGWSLWGREFLKDASGFWAFGIYDKQRRKLSLVRDQLGIKPLYYYHSKKGTCASSLLRTVIENMDEPPELDYNALSEYVRYQFTFGDKTFIKQIKKVRPGHVVEIDIDSGEITDSPYEDIFTVTGELRPPSPEWFEETRALILECILESTISDTSFTTFCSGGMDSSLITRVARPEIAYHCNYSDPECNETFYAQEVVKDFATRLFVVNAQESFDLVARVKDILEDFDEPTIGSVILPLDDLLTQVKRRYKVILTGTGGDELFGGYVRYQLALGECYQDSYRAMYNRMQHVKSVSERFEMTHHKGDTSFYQFYDSSAEEAYKEAFESCRKEGDDLQAMLRFDRRYFLAGLLNIDDKMCGRHSLESRPSLLHQRFVRHIQNLEPRAFLRNGTLKAVMRQLADGLLPKSVIHRTDKMGFTTPVGTFVNHCAHLVREQVTNSPFRHFYNLKRMNLTAETKFSREVFGLLMLDGWLNRYATAPASTSSHEPARFILASTPSPN
jgi:asparagine synthase (glutamine-hydrolysing)